MTDTREPVPETPVSPDTVARWMMDEIARRGGHLDYATAALEIVRLFGDAHAVPLGAGGFALSSEVMDAFRRLALELIGRAGEVARV